MINISGSTPLVSIGVPVYNGEKYLDECLESIHKQTYQNWVCYVINNRSTDGSLQIAQTFEKKDSRFRVITNPEFVDMTTNFNNTIKPVPPETKYFKVVCADDWIFPGYIEQMVFVLEKHPEAGICSSYRIDGNIVNCYGLDYYNGPVFPGKEVLLNELLYRYDVTGSETTVMYRMEILKKTRGYPVIYSYDSYHFDTSLAFELLSLSDLAFIFQILSYTRRHKQTYTSKYVDRFRTALNLREKELYRYRELSPEIKNEYKLVRALYGSYLLKKHLLHDTECIEWHEKRLDKERKYSLKELIWSASYLFLFKVKYKMTHKKR